MRNGPSLVPVLQGARNSEVLQGVIGLTIQWECDLPFRSGFKLTGAPTGRRLSSNAGYDDWERHQTRGGESGTLPGRQGRTARRRREGRLAPGSRPAYSPPCCAEGRPTRLRRSPNKG